MTPVILIASAGYVEPELEAEFGRLPPAFLPLGNRRLFVHQCAALGKTPSRVLLSLPDDFEPDKGDIAQLTELGVEIVKVPTGLTLGQSVVYVINVTAIAALSFAILHGDTLSQGLDMTTSDFVSVESNVPAGYRWGYVKEEAGKLSLGEDGSRGDDMVALTGFFSFSSASLLVQSVTRAGGDFLKGIVGYSHLRTLRTVKADKWLDFGHAGTYHLSRQAITTEREFNTLVANRRSITKSGSNPRKIEAESHWFETLPPPLRLFTPAYLGVVTSSPSAAYSIAYLHLPTLSDLFVFGRLSLRTWERMLSACDEFLTACAKYREPTGYTAPSASLYHDKTLQRLEAFARTTGIKLSEQCRFGGAWLPPLEQIVNMASSAIPPMGPADSTLVHGDFCFSNIFYDFRSQQVRVIDPRGLDSNDALSAYGDRRYDIGKLHHSAVGKYDLIVAGAFALQRFGDLDFSLNLPDNLSTQAVKSAFLKADFAGLTSQSAAAHPISILLFLSMLPLHADDPKRQMALLANALRLFLELDIGRGV